MPRIIPQARQGSDVDNPTGREADAAWLRRLAHTLRLEGNYVEAQVIEQELSQLLAAVPPPGSLSVRRRPGALIRRRSALQLRRRRLLSGHSGS